MAPGDGKQLVATDGGSQGSDGRSHGSDGGSHSSDGGSHSSDGGSHGRYVFGVTVRLETDVPGVWADPATVETTVYRSADQPGEEGWLFFRDNLWRGELNDPQYFATVVEDAFGVTVDHVDFRELQLDGTSLDALKAAIGEDLVKFNADSTSEVLSKYLGSSIRVE